MHGAQKEKVDLKRLYAYDIKKIISRFAAVKAPNQSEYAFSPLQCNCILILLWQLVKQPQVLKFLVLFPLTLQMINSFPPFYALKKMNFTKIQSLNP